jgi:endothelin-converting enzyme/putative endopeptidase
MEDRMSARLFRRFWFEKSATLAFAGGKLLRDHRLLRMILSEKSTTPAFAGGKLFWDHAVAGLVAVATSLAASPLLAAEAPGDKRVIDTSAIDAAVSPCQNFYRFACGRWIDANPVPADRSRWSRFDSLSDRNQDKLHNILEAAAENPAGDRKKIGDYYASCMDEAGIEAKGLDPLRGEFDRIAALDDKAGGALPALVAHYHEIGVSSFFTFGSGQDLHDATTVIARTDQGGLLLGDRDYYLRTDAKSVELREAYRAHIANMFRLLGDAPAAATDNAGDAMAIETALAKVSLDRVSRRDPKNLDHMFARGALVALTGHFAWDRFLTDVGAPTVERLNVGWPDFFSGFDAVIAQTSLPALKNYLRWHLVNRMAAVLPKAFVEENFAFYGHTLTGAQVLRTRWKRCVNATGFALGEDLGRAYVEENFPAATKAQTVAMIGEIEAAYEESLRTLDWMSEETRQRALVKLKGIVNKVGYPDHWRDYSALAVVRGDALGNAVRASAFEFRRRLDKIGKPVERGEWGMTPPTVNAYYSERYNDINFPAGILQPPFYDADGDIAANYGGIGAVMGHEITHGFDDQGRHFDVNGNLTDWWTAGDAAAFEDRAACMVKEYGGFTAVDDVKVNGKLTLGENIADNGGLSLAFAALRGALERSGRRQRLDGYTTEQRFFIGYAQTWCGNATPADERRRALTDPHSPGEFRVNGVVVNEPDFAKAFSCPAGAPMAPLPQNVCRVW